jgi:hypothetical protein
MGDRALRVLLVGPLAGAGWVSISRYVEAILAAGTEFGGEVEFATAGAGA